MQYKTPLPRLPRPTRGLRSLAGAALLLAVAGCSADGSPAAVSPDPSSPAPSESVRAPADVRYARYVALGDSYTAAPLVPETDTSNGCLRSSNNYPALVADGMPGTRLVDVSCSSADSASMIGVQQTNDGSKAPQFNALTKSTDLVTLGIGGNDFDLFGTLVGVCPQYRSSDPDGSPCRDRLSAGGADKLTAAIDEIRGHVRAIVTGIHDRAPGARVLVVGYPQILPPSGTCPELLPLAAGDYDWGRDLNVALNRALEQGASAAGGEYVDLFSATAGHDICADDPWINGRVTDWHAALAFHPFAAEQKKAAEVVLAALEQPARS